jgi:CheY-like chemotaxis protein
MSAVPSNPNETAEEAPQWPLRPYGVLVVDDDEQVRNVLDIWLRHRGYRVWLAGSGQQAIDLYTFHAHALDLVLLDARMPVMDGPQTLAALLKIDPHVCCCFMSGELGSYSEGKLRKLGAALVLSKPFRLGDVARLLWELNAPLGSETAMLATVGAMTAGFLNDRREKRVAPRRARST